MPSQVVRSCVPAYMELMPLHMPVLGNVQTIKIEMFDNFSWRHFYARSSFYIFNW